MNNLRIYLADDHPVVRNGIRGLIEANDDMEVIGETADGETAVRDVFVLKPDVVVMDVSMPNLGGAEATEQIKQKCPTIQVVILTMHEDSGYVKRLLNAGASGYVLKRSAADTLIQAIRNAATGVAYLDPTVAGKVVAEITGAQTGPEAELSARETEVIRMVAQGFLIKQIASKLDVQSRTIETYKARAMEKLGLKTRVDVIRFASEQGWLTRE